MSEVTSNSSEAPKGVSAIDHHNFKAASHWQTFEAKVLDPIRAPEVQRGEMKKAFYAGLFTCLQIAKAASSAHLTDEEGAQILDNLEKEVLDFALELDPNNDTLKKFRWETQEPI